MIYSLYIKVSNGQTVDHPVYLTNLMEVFGEVPSQYQPFIRGTKPTLGVYEEFDTEAQQYKQVDGVWTDAFPVKEMSEEGKAAVRDHYNKGHEDTRKKLLEQADEVIVKATEKQHLNAVEVLNSYKETIRNFQVQDIFDLDCWPPVPNFNQHGIQIPHLIKKTI